MVKRGLIQRSAYAAAFLAVALLSFAFTQSMVMQASAAPGTAMAMCTTAGGAGVNAKPGIPAGKSQQVCPFCAATAHAPLCGSVAPVLPSSALAWTSYTAFTPLGPRGPPARPPNARGPPVPSLTI